jgi:hypothetical protein
VCEKLKTGEKRFALDPRSGSTFGENLHRNRSNAAFLQENGKIVENGEFQVKWD